MRTPATKDAARTIVVEVIAKFICQVDVEGMNGKWEATSNLYAAARNDFSSAHQTARGRARKQVMEQRELNCSLRNLTEQIDIEPFLRFLRADAH